jgi:hypothetical protein
MPKSWHKWPLQISIAQVTKVDMTNKFFVTKVCGDCSVDSILVIESGFLICSRYWIDFALQFMFWFCHYVGGSVLFVTSRLASDCLVRNGRNCLLLVALSIFLFVSVFRDWSICRSRFWYPRHYLFDIGLYESKEWYMLLFSIGGCWCVNRSVLAVRFTRCVFAYTSFVHFDVIIFLIHLK